MFPIAIKTFFQNEEGNHFFLLKVTCQSLPYISVHHTVMCGEVVTRKSFWYFFRDYDFTIVTRERRVPSFSDQCKVHSVFMVLRPSTKNQPSILGLLIVMKKSITNPCIATVKNDWTSIVWQRIKKNFLFACGNIWNSKAAFCNKTICLLKHRCFNKDLPVASPV